MGASGPHVAQPLATLTQPVLLHMGTSTSTGSSTMSVNEDEETAQLRVGIAFMGKEGTQRRRART
jgi:hypothetical protein